MHTKKESKNPGDMWYNDKRYAAFWQHYNTMIQMTHQDALMRARYVSAQTKASLSSLHKRPSRYKSPSHTRPKHTQKPNRNRAWKLKRRSKQKRGPSHQQNILSDTETLYSKMSQGMHIQDESGEEEDMDVTDDFLNFLEQSKKHREAYKVLKARQGEGEESPVQCQGVHVPGGPKEHPDVIRSREMQQLYGEASPRIHAMETALQLTFDRTSTLHHPQYWPNIPLNIMYNNVS